MAKKIGNIANKFDIEKLLNQLKQSQGYGGDIYHFEDYELCKKTYERTGEPRDFEWVSKLYNAGYKDPITHAHTHNPGAHFGQDIIFYLDNLFGTYCAQSWINHLKPGNFLPLHRDYDRKDHLKEYGTLEMYSIHLGHSDPGHVFILEDHCHYLEPAGEIYRWNDINSLHAGFNIGYTDKYLLLYLGLRPDQPFEHEYIWSDDMTPIKMRLTDGTII